MKTLLTIPFEEFFPLKAAWRQNQQSYSWGFIFAYSHSTSEYRFHFSQTFSEQSLRECDSFQCNRTVELRFIPPYSPDFNPIENAFSVLASEKRPRGENRIRTARVESHVVPTPLQSTLRNSVVPWYQKDSIRIRV